jgi:TolB-like protein
MTEKLGFIAELKRRNVIRVSIAYLVGAWLLAQAADLVLDVMGAPDIILRSLVAILVLGFAPAVIFAWAFELTPEGIKREKEVNRDASITHVTAKKLDFVTIGMLVAVLVVVAVDRLLPEADPGNVGGSLAADSPGSSTVIPANTSSRTPIRDGIQKSPGDEAGVENNSKSIAVLPFVNMSSDPEQEYFSDGISEEILNALAKVKDLKVAGRTSSFAFKGENQDLRQVGKTLGVEHILEGSVRKSGTKVRITAQLIQVNDGFHLWSESYDRELDDVFVIQDEIAQAILEQLKAHLLTSEQTAIVAARTDTEAYDLYLLAKQRMYERSKPTLEAAAEFLDKAIAIDPEYAPAYAQRGITAILLSDEDYGDTPRDQSQAQAKLYIDQALRLNPQDPEALAALGLYYNNMPGKTAESIEALEKALAINPNMVDTANWLQVAYSSAGRIEESFRTLEDLVQRDPLYRPGLGNIIGWYVNLNRVEDAQALVERVRPSMPSDPFLFRMESQLLYANAQYAKGLLVAEKALALRPDNYPNQGLVGEGLLATGQFERLAVEGHAWQRVVALDALQRREEARLLALEEANSGNDVSTLIGLLANGGQPAEAIAFIEERWADLDAFEQDFPALGRGGPAVMLDVAYAYSSIGNAVRFEDAMRRSRQTLDIIRNFGGDNYFMNTLEAAYANLSGDPETALKHLNRAYERGGVFALPLSSIFATFKSLEGDPGYEAVQARMTERLNAERAELGLDPLLI